MNNLEWYDGEHKKLSWEDAINYCEKLGDGWRLPTIKELFSMIDHDRFDPAIDIKKYPNVQSSYYWSSTSSANYTDSAWYVYMRYGYVGYGYKANTWYVWPVRTIKI